MISQFQQEMLADTKTIALDGSWGLVNANIRIEPWSIDFVEMLADAKQWHQIVT